MARIASIAALEIVLFASLSSKTQVHARETASSSAESRSLLGLPQATSCTTPQIFCSGACVDPTTSNANCGACGASCSSITTCSAGTCVTPPLPSTPWLPQCTAPNVGNGYTLLAQAPASAPASSSLDVVNAGMTGEEWVRSTGFNASRLVPIPLPLVKGDNNVTGASVCSSNAAFFVGPTASRTTCYLSLCYSNGQCGICSGTFVADPSGAGRLLFMTATHCVASSAQVTISIANSFVTCNRNAGVTASGDGIFQPTAITISRIDFEAGYGLTDGALIQVRALSNTNLAYAKPVSVGAVTAAGLAQSVPNFSSGFPQVDSRLSGCTAENLGNGNAIHYSRVTTVRALTSEGIQIQQLSACGGNSGGTMVDEQACVLFGVLSASSTACTVAGTSFNLYSRIVASSNELGVPFLSLASGLVDGQVVFVN